MNHEDLFKLHEEMCAKALAKMREKSVDYSGGNADALVNFKSSAELGVEPELGLMTRLRDKMMRVVSFIKNGILQVKDETVEDTLIDSINYPVLCMGLIMDRKRAANTFTITGNKVLGDCTFGITLDETRVWTDLDIIPYVNADYYNIT